MPSSLKVYLPIHFRPISDISAIGFWKNGALIIRSSIGQLPLYHPSPGEISQLPLRINFQVIKKKKKLLITLKAKDSLLDCTIKSFYGDTL